MHLFHNRPFALSCMGFVGMAFLCYFLDATLCLCLSLFLFVAALALTVLYIVIKKRAFFLSCLCLGMACVAALSSALLFHTRCETYTSLVGKEVEIEGTVLSVRTTQYGSKELEVSLYLLDGEACYDSVRVYCSFDTEIGVGDSLRALATCKDFGSSETYDARAAAYSDGIFGVMSVNGESNCEKLENGRFSLRGTMLAWREVLSERLSTLIGGDEGALCVAFLLGDKSLLSDDLTLQFRRVGVSHLLALSGLHVSIIIAFLEFILKKLSCPRAVRAITVILLSLAYLVLTGCAFSTVRAVLMCCTLMLAFLFRDTYDSFTAICTALVAILVFSPWAINDLGMWMSFLAAGSIIIFQPVMTRIREHFLAGTVRFAFLRKAVLVLVGALFVGIVANLALAPIQGFVFGELPLLSIPATLLLSYPLTAALILSMLCLVFPFTAPVCRAVASLILWCTEELSMTKGIVLPLGDGYSYALLILLALSLIAIALFKVKHPLRCFLLPMAIGIALIPCSLLVTRFCFERVEAAYVSAEDGAGEALVISKLGHCVAVDLSAEDSSAMYGIVSTARAARCTEIDDLILTCYASGDVDMVSRLSGKLLVRRLRLPTPQNEWEEGLAAEISAEAALHGIDVLFDTEDLEIEEITELQMLKTRPIETTLQPILFSFSCADTRLTYANGAFTDNIGRSAQYSTLFDDTEVMIYGGTRTEKGRFPSSFPKLHTLILQSDEHKDGFLWEILEREVFSSDKKYVFE